MSTHLITEREQPTWVEWLQQLCFILPFTVPGLYWIDLNGRSNSKTTLAHTENPRNCLPLLEKTSLIHQVLAMFTSAGKKQSTQTFEDWSPNSQKKNQTKKQANTRTDYLTCAWKKECFQKYLENWVLRARTCCKHCTALLWSKGGRDGNALSSPNCFMGTCNKMTRNERS